MSTPDDDHECRISAELRDQLRRAQADLAGLRRSLEMDAEHADRAHEGRSSAFWFTCWKERNRQRAETQLEMSKLRAERDDLLGWASYALEHWAPGGSYKAEGLLALVAKLERR